MQPKAPTPTERINTALDTTADLARYRAALVSIAQHRQPCRSCGGIGKEPGSHNDACHDCGGIGEILDATPALTNPDTCAALRKATQEPGT